MTKASSTTTVTARGFTACCGDTPEDVFANGAIGFTARCGECGAGIIDE